VKKLKRKILFCLASEVDFFKKGEDFAYYPYSFLYTRLSIYQKSSVRDSTLQLVRAREVDRISRNRKAFFRLTSQGRSRLLSFFPISLGQSRVWDRIWRIAVISSPDVNSTPGLKDPRVNELRTLRRKLRELGFKQFSRGVYLNPLPVSMRLKTLLLEENFSAKIAVIESRRLVLGDNKQLAKMIWPLDELLIDYQNLITKINRLLKRFKKKKRLLKKDKIAFPSILDSFFSLLEKDPGLPKKLLPPDWPFDSVKERFFRLAKLIEKQPVNF